VLHTCLGREDAADLRAVLRSGGDLEAAIREAIAGKPQGHDFHIERGAPPAIARHMSATGG
jgi:cyclic pyranopterin phosphate synthase